MRPIGTVWNNFNCSSLRRPRHGQKVLTTNVQTIKVISNSTYWPHLILLLILSLCNAIEGQL